MKNYTVGLDFLIMVKAKNIREAGEKGRSIAQNLKETLKNFKGVIEVSCFSGGDDIDEVE